MKRVISLYIAVLLIAAGSNAGTASPGLTPPGSAFPSASASGTRSEPPATARPVAASPSPRPSPTAAPAATPPPLPTANGWPFTAQTAGLGTPAFGPDGSLYVDVTAVVDDPNRGSARFARLAVLDPSGRMRAGWPVELGQGWLTGFAVGGDGSVAVVVCSDYDMSTESRDCRLSRLSPDGQEDAGFPFLEPNVSFCEKPLIASDDTTYLTCVAGDESTIRVSAVGANAGLKPGWPVVLETTLPLVDTQLAPDGTLFVVSTSGRWALRIHALTTDGSARFAVTLPETSRYQYRRLQYLIASDGTLRVWWYEGDVEDQICVHAERTMVSAIGSDGRTLPGWPNAVPGVAVEPVLDEHGTLYVASAQGGMSEGPVSVTAIHRDGRTEAGWPVAVEGLRASCPELEVRLARSPGGMP